MNILAPHTGVATDESRDIFDVSIVMPCLNEVVSLPHCIANARKALTGIRRRYGLSGEILIADNGSTDGSQELATRLGARVVSVTQRGYGAALVGGGKAAAGRFVLMGDADGSYDFTDGVAMIGRLLDGADLCMGSRFKGGIKPGAMPWKNRYIGNPVLTGILNLLFRAGISDAHCGLRALSKACLERLNLRGTGMEFASEMVIKAALLGEKIVEVPATLHPDLRTRPPHLRPWRDGWRHLRYLMMLSPSWVFAVPAAICAALSLSVLTSAGLVQLFRPDWVNFYFGNYWEILAGSLLEISHIGFLMALACQLYGVREGYRRATAIAAFLSRSVSLETMLGAGLVCLIVGLGILFAVSLYWSARDFTRIGNVLPMVVGTSLFAIGIQNILGGFLLAVIGGNEARFFAPPEKSNISNKLL